MQQTLGNQGVLRRLQAKLAVSQPGDAFEQEADRVAEAVMSQTGSKPISAPPMPVVGPAAPVQRKCAACEQEDEDLQVQRKEAPAAPAANAAPSVQRALNSPGQHLDRSTRSIMESMLGHDFSHVRVHTDVNASKSAEAVDALAYTVGSDVVFGESEYRPETASGKRLLAHELTHVIQQSATGSRLSRQERGKAAPGATNVSLVLISLGSQQIQFQTSSGNYTYDLVQGAQPLVPGGFTASVKVVGNNVHMSAVTGNQSAKANFGYKLRRGGENPSTFFHGQTSVHVTVISEPLAAQASSISTLASASAGISGSETVHVQVLTAAQFQAMTGQSADQLPEGQFKPGADVANGPSILPGGAFPMVTRPGPGLPFPVGTTGITWQGSHLSHFVVEEGSPLSQLIFGEGSMRIRGFRSDLLTHARSQFLERGPLGELLYGPGGGPATIRLNRGAPGTYANDLLFPYMPGATAVTPLNLTPDQAERALKAMNAAEAGYKGQNYTFSTVPRDNPYYATSYGNVCPPGVVNCITLQDVTEQVLGGRRRLVLQRGGQTLDIQTGEVFDAAGVRIDPANVDPAIWENARSLVGRNINRPGMAANMDKYIAQNEEAFTKLGLEARPISGAMWARAGAGFIRVGGTVLMVYGAYKTGERIANAPEEEKPIVIAEEAGSWGGGFIGNVLGSALGGAFVCSETGPGAFVCGLVFGIAGGVTGSVIGESAMHNVGKTIVDVGKITPAQLIEGATLMFGSPEDKRNYYQWRKFETGESNPFDY